jgi:predicted RecA/RadA family phage recombinase
MAYTQTAEFELASREYIDIQNTTDGSTTYSEGELILQNNCLAFCLADVAISSKFAAVQQCNKVNALKAAEAMDAGQKLYWDNSASKVTVTDTSAGLPPVGYVLEDAASGDNTVTMSFDARGQASLTVAT